MEINILNERQVPLLSRKRVNFEVLYGKEPTPKKDDVLKLISEKLKISNELIHINHIYPKFGEHKAKVIANIYKDIKELNFVEKINKKPKVEKKAEVAAPKVKTKTK